MNSFVVALASIALVLVNMGIGWALAKYHTRRHPQPVERPLLAPPVVSEMDDAPSNAELVTEEAASDMTTEVAASTNDPESQPSDFSISAARAFGALATASEPEYHS